MPQDEAAGVEVSVPPRLSQPLHPFSNHLCHSALSVPGDEHVDTPGRPRHRSRARSEDAAEALPVTPPVLEPLVPQRAICSADEDIEAAWAPGADGGLRGKDPAEALPITPPVLEPFVPKRAVRTANEHVDSALVPGAPRQATTSGSRRGSPSRSSRSRTTCARARYLFRGRKHRGDPSPRNSAPGPEVRTPSRLSHPLQVMPSLCPPSVEAASNSASNSRASRGHYCNRRRVVKCGSKVLRLVPCEEGPHRRVVGDELRARALHLHCAHGVLLLSPQA